ncbi:MAG: type I methionyl aminopeptidase [bacterium]|nr:type I methionyl aminopeptidase [bacterium]
MIILKSDLEIEKIRKSSQLAVKALEVVKEKISEGVTLKKLDKICYKFITQQGAIPAFLGYKGFPASICTSVNFEVVHGIPGNRRLVSGDIISIDLGVLLDGYYGDVAATFPVDHVSDLARRLLQTTEEALYKGIEACRVGNRLSDISYAIQSTAERYGFSVVREFVGHGIGRSMHEDPQVPNFGEPGKGVRLKPGMVLCLEPMVNAGGWETEVMDDGWTVITKDRSLSCHFEHTVAITKDGSEILTQS